MRGGIALWFRVGQLSYLPHMLVSSTMFHPRLFVTIEASFDDGGAFDIPLLF